MKDDPGITTSVKQALAENGRISALDINVSSQHGVVTLRGLVDIPEQADAAVQVASQVEGVREVRNELGLREISLGAAADEVANLEEEEEIWSRI